MKLKVEKNEGRGVKRERDDNAENVDGGVIEIVSDDDLDNLQVIRTNIPCLSDF